LAYPLRAQTIKLEGIQKDEFIGDVNLMPDSSLLVLSVINEINTVKRYVNLNGLWVEKDNSLNKLINSLSNQHKHLLFSIDYSKLVVLTTEDKENRAYLFKKSVQGDWELPVEILKRLRNEFQHSPPSISVHGEKFYTTAYGLSASNIIIHNAITEVEEKSIKIDEFERIDQVYPLNISSFIVAALKRKDKHNSYFYIQIEKNGNYTAPLYIPELVAKNPSDRIKISLSPFPGWVIAQNQENKEISMIKLSARITEEWVGKSPNQRQTIPSTAEETETNNYVSPQGQYHALLIGNSLYKDRSINLEQPVEDVLKLKEILLSKYSFEEENIVTLLNGSRSQILIKLYQLRLELDQDDNLLIFYAGHGYWDKAVEQGYWWPTDVDTDNPSNWLSNSDLKEQIRAIPTAHTLLISDACFSGGIFKTRGVEDLRDANTSIQLLYRMPSRRAISSGTLSTVPDNSVFFKYLSKYLEDNENKYLPSTELFTSIRKSVLNNSHTVPQDGVIMGTGDEGGDFIFISKKQ
jgi:hypothetical protein